MTPALRLGEFYGLDEQAEILDSDRSNNFLDTTRLESLYPVKHIKDSVRELLQNYKRDLNIKKAASTDFPNSKDTDSLSNRWFRIH